MIKSLLASLPVVGLAALAAHIAVGSCYLAPLDDTVRDSEVILIGTVVAKTPMESAGADHLTAHLTHYRLDKVRYMKGDGPSDSLLLVQPDGYDEPAFSVGGRYVILAAREGGNFRAYACETPYTVRADSSRNEPVIFKKTTPLVEFTDSTMVWGMGPHYGEKAALLELARGIFLRRDDGARVSESEFADRMTRLVHRVGKRPK